MNEAAAKIPWLPRRVIVSRVARHLGCAVEYARLRIIQEAEAGRIKACGLTVEGWPMSLLPAAWREVDWDGDVDLRLDALIAADLLTTDAFERAWWTAAQALAWIIMGVPLVWIEWAGLPELGGGMEQAGIELARAIGEDQVRAQGRLFPQGPMESLPGSDLRIPGFRWLVRPDGDLGTSPPGRLAVFLGRRWYGIEVDSATVRQAFPKPLRVERRMLDEAEQLYAEGGSEPTETETTRWARELVIAVAKRHFPPEGKRPKGVSIASLTKRFNKEPEFKENKVSEDTVDRAFKDIEAARQK
jgi:hypothetical protein